jgi:hypothetical protein
MRQRTNIIFQKSQTDFLKTITVSFIIQPVSEISTLILTSDSSGQEQQNLYCIIFSNSSLFNEFVCKLGFLWHEWASLKHE